MENQATKEKLVFSLVWLKSETPNYHYHVSCKYNPLFLSRCKKVQVIAVSIITVEGVMDY